MINQKIGKLIEQKAVAPTFDFGTIKGVVDNYVKNYDSGLEARALNHIVENWDSIPKRIKDLKKRGGTKVTKASRAKVGYSDRDTDGNQLTEAQKEFFAESKARDESGMCCTLCRNAEWSPCSRQRLSP